MLTVRTHLRRTALRAVRCLCRRLDRLLRASLAPASAPCYVPSMPFTLAPDRAAAARALAAALVPGRRVCLTTHVNPDGDGLGSEAGLAHLLRDRGIEAVITNPTPTPPRFEFLFEDLPGVDRTAEAIRELRRADTIVVLDISDLGRLGMLGETVRDRGVPVACVDHHVSEGVLPAGPALPRRRGRRHRRARSSRWPWPTGGR